MYFSPEILQLVQVSGLFSSENYSIHIMTFQDLEETEYAKYSIQNLKHFKQETNPMGIVFYWFGIEREEPTNKK